MLDTATEERDEMDLGKRVRALRANVDMTIKEVSLRSGMSASAISKIENNQLSPTYESIIKLARGLGVDISELFSDSSKQVPRGRRSFTRKGEGKIINTKQYIYEMLCTDLIGKKMMPLKATLKAHEIRDFGKLIAHVGEEVVIVLSGRVELRTEFYEPLVLEEGDCAYFDSTMGHACLAAGDGDAELFWVCSSNEVLGLS